MIAHIYKLINPKTNKPVYVGATTNEIGNRMSGHLTSVKSKNSKMYKFFRENNVSPEIEVIETVEVGTIHELAPIERAWILKLRSDGEELFNKAMPSISSIPDEYIRVAVSKKVHAEVKAYLKLAGGDIGKFYDNAAMSKLNQLKNKSAINRLSSQTLIDGGWQKDGSYYRKGTDFMFYTGTEWLFNGELLTEQNYLEKIK